MANADDDGRDEADLARQLARRLAGDGGCREALANLDFFVETMSPSLLEVWLDLVRSGPGGLAGAVYFVMCPADHDDSSAAAAFWAGVGHPRPSAPFLRAFIEAVPVQLR
jgi:hypothetical protein